MVIQISLEVQLVCPIFLYLSKSVFAVFLIAKSPKAVRFAIEVTDESSDLLAQQQQQPRHGS